MSLEVLPSVAETPTRGRYKVLTFLCVLAFIFYVDRICISKAVPDIKRDLDISNTAMGFVLAAFTFAYFLFEVPTGWWGDRYGSRGVLTRIVVWWSVFTALTGTVLGLPSLLLVRFLFGAGEAGAYPNMARILVRWFPAQRRGPALGLISTTALIGGAFAPAAAGEVMGHCGWRWTFVIFSVPGFIWAVVFYRWYRDNPADHPAVNEAERRLIGAGAGDPGAEHHPPIPWRLVLTSPNIWLLGGVLTCASFNSYMYFSWYPTYLEAGRGVDSVASGWLASMVLGGGALGSMLGGFVSDILIRRTGNRRASRSILGFYAMMQAGVLLLIGLHTDDSVVAAIWTALGVFSLMLMLPSWWGAVADISGRHVGALFGLLNSIGGLGAIVSQLFLGAFADWMAAQGYVGRDQWDPAFYIYAGTLFLGGCGWLAVDATRTVEPVPAVSASPSGDGENGKGLGHG